MEAPSIPGTAIEVPFVPESAMEASPVPEEAYPISEPVMEASPVPKDATWVVPLNEAVTTTEAAPVPKAVKEAYPVPEKTVSILVATTEATPLPEAANETPSVPETATECLRPHHFENVQLRQISEAKQSWVWSVLAWETATQAFRGPLVGPCCGPCFVLLLEPATGDLCPRPEPTGPDPLPVGTIWRFKVTSRVGGSVMNRC